MSNYVEDLKKVGILNARGDRIVNIKDYEKYKEIKW